jgi:hypothetical protein
MRVNWGRRSVPLVFALAAALVVPAGCSYMQSKPPPERPLRWEGECTSSRWPVLADVYLSLNTGGIALLSFVAAAVAASNASDETVPSWDPHPRSTENVPLFLAVGALGTAATYGLIRSAAYGLRSGRDCDQAVAELQRARAGWPPPSVWYWAPPPAPQAEPAAPLR